MDFLKFSNKYTVYKYIRDHLFLEDGEKIFKITKIELKF